MGEVGDVGCMFPATFNVEFVVSVGTFGMNLSPKGLRPFVCNKLPLLSVLLLLGSESAKSPDRSNIILVAFPRTFCCM